MSGHKLRTTYNVEADVKHDENFLTDPSDNFDKRTNIRMNGKTQSYLIGPFNKVDGPTFFTAATAGTWIFLMSLISGLVLVVVNDSLLEVIVPVTSVYLQAFILAIVTATLTYGTMSLSWSPHFPTTNNIALLLTMSVTTNIGVPTGIVLALTSAIGWVLGGLSALSLLGGTAGLKSVIPLLYPPAKENVLWMFWVAGTLTTLSYVFIKMFTPKNRIEDDQTRVDTNRYAIATFTMFTFLFTLVNRILDMYTFDSGYFFAVWAVYGTVPAHPFDSASLFYIFTPFAIALTSWLVYLAFYAVMTLSDKYPVRNVNSQYRALNTKYNR